ncbi:MAG: virulence-associated E family protein [Steroidobacteraceae bacterium]
MDRSDNDTIIQLLEAMQKRGKKPKAPPRARPNDWRMLLAESSDGYMGDERNILIAMRTAPELKDLVRYNAMALDVEITRAPPWRKFEDGLKWTETDDTHCIAWLQSQQVKVRNRGAVADCVAVVAQEASYHPVRNYLSALKWDGEPRLKLWLAEYLNAVGDPEYQSAVGMRYLVSGAARVLQPGCQADHVLVLEGPQGTGKTTAARTLAVRSEWFAGELPDIGSKDAMLQLAGRWIIEIAELKAVKTSEIERTKSFITQTHDTFRPPYGRRTAQFPRQCVFIGTTNEAEYLRDRTGNRRYWPVRCGRIDLEALLRDRDQLWAEARHEYEQGSQWHLSATEAALATGQQIERVHVTELQQDVETFLAREREAGKTEVTVRDVLVYGLGLDPGAPTYATTARQLGASVAEAMLAAGWAKVGRIGGNRTVYRRRE